MTIETKRAIGWTGPVFMVKPKPSKPGGEPPELSMEKPKVTLARGDRILTSRAFAKAIGEPERIEPIWSTDGRWVAWWVRGLASLLEGFPGTTLEQLAIETLTLGTVEIVAPELRLTTDVLALTATLTAAGYHICSTRPTPKPRAKSIIYARKALDASAKTVIPLVPGGATVARPKKKTPYDLVIELGAPPLPPAPTPAP